MSDKSFGVMLRAWRTEKQISLRRFADLIGVSPTYLSKIERDELPPPAEEKLRAIAAHLGRDEGEMFALAHRAPADAVNLLKTHPEMVALLRTAQGLSPDDIRKLMNQAERARKKAGRTEGKT